MSATSGAKRDMPAGLLKRDGRYSIRRIIPKDLQGLYGRQVITRALKTSSYPEAKRRCIEEWLKLDREFDAARQKAAPGPAPDDDDHGPNDARPTPLEEISPTRISVVEVDRLRRQRQEAAASGKLQDFTRRCRDTLRLTQAMLDGDMEPSHPLAELEGVRNALTSVLNGEGAHYIAAARQAREAVDRDKRLQSGPELTVLVSRWAQESKPILRTVKRTSTVVEEFEAFVGRKPAAKIERANVIAYKDHLLAKGQTASNINVKLSLLSLPFAYALRNDIVEKNPVQGISVADKRKARDKRRAFSDEELARLFAGPVHQKGDRPEAGGGEAAYWLPLLALYTGARLTELGQLHADDVVQESYIADSDKEQQTWVIRIVENQERGQRLKTEGSERRVPVHSDLQSLGFISFVKAAKQAGHKRLFSGIKGPAVGDLMAAWSKWFGRYRRSLGVAGKDTPFHSFRHAFKHYARLSGIQAEVHNAITGHETGDVADTYGGPSYPLRPLVEAMKLYRVPGLALPPPANGL